MSVAGILGNLSIRNKIVAAFCSLVVVIAVLGAASLQKFSTLNASVEDVTNDAMLGIGYLGEMRGAVLHYRLVVSKAIYGKASGGDLDAIEKSLAEWNIALGGTGSEVCSDRRNG